jgi:hypothetical protein
MIVPSRSLLVVLVTLGALLPACGTNDVDDVTDAIEDIEDADDARQAADVAWASFRTDFERLADEAATDEEAQRELAEACRDALAELREADDSRADQLESLCDDIRDADVEAEWEALQEEIERFDADS